MKWDDARIGLAVFKAGSLAGAAKLLGIDPTTVGRRVLALERAIGQQLFEHGEKSITVTPQGRLFFLDIAGVEGMLASAVLRSAGIDGAATGEVRLTAVTTLFTHFLLAHVPKLKRDHPGICLELIGSSEQLNLGQRKADLAVRMSRPDHGDLFVRRLADIGYRIYAAEGLMARLGSDPARLPWIRHDNQFQHLPEAQWVAREYPDAEVSTRAQVGLVMAAAVEAGIGTAILPTYVGAQLKGVRALSELLLTREAWLVVHRDIRNVPRIRAVADWIVEVFGREQATLAD